MKTSEVFLLYLTCLVLAILQTACGMGHRQPIDAGITTVVPEAIATSRSTRPPLETMPNLAPTPSQTPKLTRTPTVQPAPSSTATVTATPSWTPLPTLESTLTKDQAEAMIYELLHDDNACRFPCWWGIEPDKTPGREVRQFFKYLGNKLEERPYDSFRIAMGTGFLKEEAADAFSISIGFFEKSGKIEVIDIESNGRKDGWFYKYWEPYSIEKLLANYGRPSRVWIKSLIRERGMGYSIWIFYDDLGALIIYDGFSTWLAGPPKEDTKYQLCPRLRDNQIYGLRIDLKSPSNKLALSKFEGRYATAAAYLKPLEEVSDLSIDEFYELLTQPGMLPCFAVRDSG